VLGSCFVEPMIAPTMEPLPEGWTCVCVCMCVYVYVYVYVYVFVYVYVCVCVCVCEVQSIISFKLSMASRVL